MMQDINATIAKLKTKRTIQMVEWSPAGFKIGTFSINCEVLIQVNYDACE